MVTAIVLGAVAVTLAVLVFALVRLRRALDGVELTLRVIVTGMRIATRAAGNVPATAAHIGSNAVAGRAELDRLEDLKVRPSRRRSRRRGNQSSQRLRRQRFPR